MQFDVQLAKSVQFTEIESYVKSNDFSFEQKLDGERLAIVVKDGNITGCGRRNETFVDRDIQQALSFITGDWVIDGEMVNGVFWAFDLPVSAVTCPETPFITRRGALEITVSLLATRTPKIKLVPSAMTPDEKFKLAKWCVDNNAEGVMIKKNDAPYTEGKRSDFTLKAKLVETADVIVTEVGREGKRSVAVAVYGPNRNLVPIGSVTVTEKMLGRLQPGDVIEVRYLYTNDPDKPRLYQPAFLKIRTDKVPSDCSIGQLKYTSKTVLPTL